MRFGIAIVLFTIIIGCNDQEKRDSMSKSNNYSDSISCNHNDDYSFCDNVDTAILHRKNIKQLIIFRKSYTTLPNEISKLKNLKGLTLKNQSNINWDDAFLKLSLLDSLEFIEIIDCPIRDLAGISKLLNLKELFIYDKSAFFFPRDLFFCDSLTELRLICPIKQVPEDIMGLENLIKLTITISAKEYPKSLTLFPKLEYLDIGGNIEELPLEIANLKNLKTLLIYDTHIGKEELIYYRKYNNFIKLKSLKDKMTNCNFILEAPLPPI